MAQATHAPKTDAPQRDPRPQCEADIVETGCEGPPPTPWLSWKHCFRVYEFREILLGRNANAAELKRKASVFFTPQRSSSVVPKK